MRKLVAVFLSACVLCSVFAGCNLWMQGEYNSVEPYQDQNREDSSDALKVSSYDELLDALREMIGTSSAEGVITLASFSQESAKELGRKGERVAKTPIRLFPPSLGGRTVGENLLPSFSENPQIIHTWLYFSSPLKASATLYSGSKTRVALISLQIPLCLGKPNFVGKAVLKYPIGLISIFAHSLRRFYMLADTLYLISAQT